LTFLINFLDGKIKKQEFLDYMKTPSIYEITMNELEQQFHESDKNHDGFINMEELGDILRTTTGITDEVCYTLAT
jgi:Ca2+-binding EF-hand superfamily protein